MGSAGTRLLQAPVPSRNVQPRKANRPLWNAAYFGGAGVKTSRLEGSGFGFGFGAFFASFLPLSLFPINASMTQLLAEEKSCGGFPVPSMPRAPARFSGRKIDRPVPHPSSVFCRKRGEPTLLSSPTTAPCSSASSLPPQTRPASSSRTSPDRWCSLSPPTALARLPAPAAHPLFSGYRPPRPSRR